MPASLRFSGEEGASGMFEISQSSMPLVRDANAEKELRLRLGDDWGDFMLQILGMIRDERH